MTEHRRIAPAALRRALGPVCSLGLTTAAAALLTFATQVVLARKLAVHEYGALASVLALITLVAPVAGLGLGPFWLHIFGVEGWRGHRWLRPSLLAILGAALCVWSGLAIVALRGGVDTLTRTLLLILLPVVAGQAAIPLVEARYQLEHRYAAVAVWQLVAPSGRILVALVASSAYLAAVGLAVWAVAICGVTAAMMLRACRQGLAIVGHKQGTLERADTPPVTAVVVGAVPFALSGFLHFVHLQSDVVMVGWMVGSAAAAQYNVAFTVLMALYLAPSVVNQKYLLPKLHRWASHDPAQLRPVCYFTSLAMLVAGLLATAALLVLVDETLPRLFGARYRDAAALLKILALAVPTRYVSLVLGAFLTTRHHVRRKVMLQAITAGINVALNSVLIPRHGAHGAAIATVVTEAVLLAVYVAAVRHQISLPTLEMKELSAKPAGSSG